MSNERLAVASGRQSWSWLRRELGRRRLATISLLLTSLVAAAASIAPVYVLGLLVDRVRSGAGGSALWSIGAVILAASAVGGIATGVSAYLSTRLGGQILATLREAVVARALTLSSRTLERTGKGELLSRVGADVSAIDRVVGETVPSMISAALLGVLSVVAMAGMDWRLGLAGLVSLPLYVIGLRWYLPRSAPLYAQERNAISDRSQHLIESMHGARTIHAYGLHEHHLRAVDEASGSARDTSVVVFGLFTRFVGRVHRAEFAGLAALMVAGFYLVRAEVVTVGDIVAATVMFHRLFNPISMLLYTFDRLQDAGASLARLVGVVALADDATVAVERVGVGGSADPREESPGPNLSAELRDVRFGYTADTEVLRGLTVRIAPGERVAMVGATGAGKTTAAALLAGIHPPGGGSVLIGDVPLNEIAPERLRDRVAIITQETHVFAGQLADDLRLARPEASDDEARAALTMMGAQSWVAALPDGIHTVVGEGGHGLTAAQAQQVALARLVLADPAVAVLDEATAEAGSAGARQLERSAEAATAKRTTLVIAHRLTQAAAADRVVVLDKGRIVEQGTHEELVASNGRYAELWQAWVTRAPATNTD